MMSQTTNAAVLLSANDLNAQGGVCCPNPRAKMELWNMHPRVYLDVARTGAARCPYCGTLYQLAPGQQAVHSH